MEDNEPLCSVKFGVLRTPTGMVGGLDGRPAAVADVLSELDRLFGLEGLAGERYDPQHMHIVAR